MLAPVVCTGCGEAFVVDAAAVGVERHQVWEIPAPRAVVTEYQRRRFCCRRCGHVTTAPLPDGAPIGMFGANLEAAIIALTTSQRLSRRATREVLDELCGVEIGAGTIDRVLQRSAPTLQSAIEEIDADIAASSVRHVDETSWRINGSRAWAWVAVTKRSVRFRITPTRSRDALTTLVGEHPAGITISDRYNAYAAIPDDQRQVCWAHLARDHLGLATRPGVVGELGTRLTGLTKTLFAVYHTHRDDPDALTETTMAVRSEIWEALDGLYNQTTDQQARSYAYWLLTHDDALYSFLTHPGVDPTNNAAERALRHLVIHRKTSLGTNTDRGTRTYETLQSITSTLRHQHQNVYTWLREALAAANHHTPLPSILTPLPQG